MFDWFRSGRTRPTVPDAKTDGRGTIPDSWMLDAPLFIDERQIKSLYNAVALPEFERESLTVAKKDVKVSKWSAEGQVEVSAGESLLSKLLVGLSAKGTAKGTRGGETTRGADKTWRLIPVDTPERRLLNLAIHYAAYSPERVWTVRGLDDLRWLEDPNFGEGTPRSLIFLEIPPGSPIVPMAAELPDGKVVLFYELIAEQVTDHSVPPPPDYPRDGEGGAKMAHYWDWFQSTNVKGGNSSWILMRVVEEAVQNGRPRWIDYRVPLGPSGAQYSSLHLHLKGRETYDTGDFAYQVIRRGRTHGLRLIGTLKQGPALNVLAVVAHDVGDAGPEA